MAVTINRFVLLPYQREKIEIITDHIRNRKNLHIYGAEGTAKSALLDWIYDHFKEIDSSLIPIYCMSSRTLRQVLLYISGFLLNYFKHLESIDIFKRIQEIRFPSDIKKLNIRTLRNLVFSYISQDTFIIILDHLECITPKINAFLKSLYEKTLVITASRQSWETAEYFFKGRIDYCLYLVPKLKIENLKIKDAFILMEHLYNNLNIRVSDKFRMFREIFNITDGNPKIIKEIFEKAQRPEYFRNKMPNLKLIQIDLQIDKIHIL